MPEHVIEIGGLPIPDGRPVFLAFLGVHIAAGLWCVVTGAVAASARKRVGRHPRVGRRYLLGLGVLTASLVVLSVLRWPQTVHLLVIGVLSMTAAAVGVTARRRQWPHWPVVHAVGMAGSYIGLCTGFLIDNGPLLPGWRELPHALHWTLPTILGLPLLVRALARYRSEAARPRRSG
ncbi:MAG: hypothetical protein L0H84_24645 [Pseudonocardia sp.]|nr:hypothetical protein [Pseudonocardia sp.]